LNDSFKNGNFISDYSKYKLKCFEGLNMLLLGFGKGNEEIKYIKKVIEENKGKMITNVSESDIIVIKSGVILSNNEFNLLETRMSKTVKDDWIHKCISEKAYQEITDEFKFQNDYFNMAFQKIQEKYSAKYDKYENSALILKDFIFYISEEFDKELINIIRQAISLGGGIYYNKLTPLTTHIICNENKHLYTVRHFGKIYKPSLINQEWVFSSLREGKLQPESNYKPLSSITILNESNKEVRKEMEVSTNRFKNRTFYILQESYQPHKYEEIRELILANSGEIVFDTTKANFIVINDKYYNLSYYLENRVEGFQWVVNHRYIDFCLEKDRCIDLNSEKYLHIFPFSFDLPLEGFNEIIASTLQFPTLEIEVFESLVLALGGEVVDEEFKDYSTLKKVTHLICYAPDKLDTTARESIAQKYNRQVKLVTVEWIADCMINGKKLDDSKYQIILK
jgi:hypothetical protein